MKEDIFEGRHLKPANGLTAKVVLSKGVHFQSKPVPIIRKHWETPQPIIPLSPGQEDLTDKRCGRMTVMGKYGNHSKKGSLWQVRCPCGDYEVRTSKAIKNPKNTDDRCQKCEQLDHLRYLAR